MNHDMRLGWLGTLAVCATFFLAMIAAVGQTAPAASGPDQKHVSKTRQDTAGDKIFEQNCVRCHTPPMTLNPRVTGTVIQHMRVRAHLTSREQEILLKYLAP